MNNLTNPQPSGNPLNLMYKGVFSTRLSLNNKSLYGHYLDKLYQVQFLGIGTLQADVIHGVVDAVMLRQTSIDDRVGVYKATRNKYGESVVLEVLGGEPVTELHAKLHTKDAVVANIRANELDFIELLTAGKHSYGTEGVSEVLSRRLNVLKNAEISGVLFALPEIADGILDDIEEKVNRTFIGAVVEYDRNRRFNKYVREASDSEVRKNIIAVQLRMGDIRSTRGAVRKDQSGIELVGADGKVLRRADVTLLDSFTHKYKEVSNQREYTDTGITKIKMTEYVLDVVMQETAVDSNMIVVADMDALGLLIKKADVATEYAYLTEKVLAKKILEMLPVAATLSDRKVSLAHYMLYQDHADYKNLIDTALLSDSAKVSRETITVIEKISKEINDNYGHELDAETARRIYKALGEYQLDVSMSQLMREAGETLGYGLNGSGKSANHVNIEFNHELQAEDGKELMTLLDLMYEGFKTIHEQGTVLDGGYHGRNVVKRDAIVVEHLLKGNVAHNNALVQSDSYGGAKISKEASTLSNDEHGALWSDSALFLTDSREEELFGELTSSDDTFIHDHTVELLTAELTSEDSLLAYDIDEELFGEMTGEQQRFIPETETDLWAELTSDKPTSVFSIEREVFGELTSEPTEFQSEFQVEITGVRLTDNVGFASKDYVIAVLGCAEPPELKYRRRPPLEPDKVPEDPLFEWNCTEGYVCDDWLIVPLKDFNFENTEQDGFYDPVTYVPYYPTGQTDNNGDPFVLPPYSVLNEPISNGVDVGGKEPMSIDPCNLYSFIQYTVKIYDAYKARFQASTPIDTISRVMNMLFEQVQTLIAEWDETKGYTPDELWRIYRFIRWIALGITNRFYRVKIEYTYGDFAEQFEVHPFTDMLTAQGAARKNVSNYGWVLEGHPIAETAKNSASFEFELPYKTQSSTISFEMGNVVPDRPDALVGGAIFQENFEGLPSNFKINGDGWVPVRTQSGTGLGVEDPARVKTYRTSTFNVPSNALSPFVRFNYGIDTNMNSKLLLKSSSGTIMWQSTGVVTYGTATVHLPAGNYYFETTVPQAESGALSNISFTATQIQNEWKKLGYVTEWKVVGDTIYEDENTPGVSMVINPQWTQDNDYELELEFFTKDVPANYGLIDWIGIVLNYKDSENYYLFGTWSSLDGWAYGGLQKTGAVGSISDPVWKINPDFRFKIGHWHKLRAVVKGNRFTIYIDGTRYLDVVDNQGWGFGASGLAAYSNPLSSFRNVKYKGKPRFDAFIDNVVVDSQGVYVPVPKPKYSIDFYLDGDSPRIQNYLQETKRAFSFPIMVGEHKAKWVFSKQGGERSVPQDASFIDNIVVKGMKIVKAEVVEEFIACGGHFAVRLLIENLLEYYRRHHQGCKGERNIWIVE